MTAQTNTNGTMRKTLASQLDRLDGILDALGEGLNEAVAHTVQQAVGVAVREAVAQAVQGVISELLNNPNVHALLRSALSPVPVATPAPMPTPAPAPSMSWWQSIKAGCRKASSACSSALGKVKGIASSAWQMAKPYKTPLLIAAGAGLGVAVAAYFAGPCLAAASGWLVGFAAALAIQARHALKKLASLASSLTG
jgi:hypothetical protein